MWTQIFFMDGFRHCRITHSCFSLVYMPLEAAPTEELILYSTINEDENLEEIEVLHADGTNTGTLNSFRTSNGLITDEWTRRGLFAGFMTEDAEQRIRDFREKRAKA